jgi:hypothetical protein
MTTDKSRVPGGAAWWLNALFLGLTAMLIGYFMVWLPGPAAGLQLIGIELGEWIKFLGVGRGRDWFYLPPIVIGLIIALLAATWPNGRLATWLARGLAVAVALLAFPAVAAIQLEPRSEWLPRLLGIGLVLLVAALGAVVSARTPAARWPWLVIALVALAGLVLPTAQYLAVRPVAEAIMQRPLGIGPGLWLNGLGSLLAAAAALLEWRARWLETK